MSKRERGIAVAVGLFAAACMLYVAVNGLLLAKLKDYNARAGKLGGEIELAQARNDKKTVFVKALTRWEAQTLSGGEHQVGAKLRERISDLLQRTGLNQWAWKIDPLPARPVSNHYREVGWNVSAEGGLRSIVDFLYLLDAEPYLHRIDKLDLASVARSARLKLDVKYVTIVFPEGQAERPGAATSRPVDTRPSGDLEAPRRRGYEVIVSRDVLRPYIRRPPERAPEQPEPIASPPAPGEPAQPPEARFRVVALPTWGGQTDVFVRDGQTGETRRYKIGDSLAGGKIVIVDYRPMPMPARKEILSPSRVIVLAGQDYWAVELGQSLTDKHRLSRSQLPAAPTSGPAETPAGDAATGEREAG